MGKDTRVTDKTAARQVARAFAATDRQVCFGPTFFLSHLGAFVRASCPSPGERIGVVDVHLLGGEVLEVCHVVSLAPGWVALATFEGGRGAGEVMRTELAPYALITRVSVRSEARASGRIGFEQENAPQVYAQGAASAETLLARASGRR